MQGPDHRASLEPREFGLMVKAIRQLEVAMGHGHKVPQASELNTRMAARKQVVAARPIAKGHTFTREDLETARSGQGLPAHELWQLIGRVAQHDFAVGKPYKHEYSPTTKQTLGLLGAGGHASVVLALLRELQCDVLGVSDPALLAESISKWQGLPVWDDATVLTKHSPNHVFWPMV